MKIAIVGAGPAGLAAGHELLAKGFEDFTLFEATDAAGGTWHLHSYPGLACDVWAHSYTFTYAPNPDWSASFVEQPEIEAYLQRCAQEFGLNPHIRFNSRISRATWEEGGHWLLETDTGERHQFDVVINAMGNQHTPLFPDVPGIDSFTGESWHATRWNHDVELAGKRVAVVGSAASAVQIVPELAKQVGQLTVLQRTANWIMPRNRKLYSESRRQWYRRLPLLISLTRKVQGLMMGQVEYAATLGHNRMNQFEKLAKKYIDSVVEDPQMREQLTPDSRYGCKRGLVSDGFYPALVRDNVELVASGVREITPTGLVTDDGRELVVDVIIYCTGYKILDFDRIEVVGVNEQTLEERMGDDPQAFKGIAVPGFPNYFFAVGPNGLVLNVPYFVSVEQNVETIVRLLQTLDSSGAKQLSVTETAHREYNDWMAGQFGQYSWGSPSCNSYYQNASGHAPFLFPGNFKDYARLHQQVGPDDYEIA